MYFWKEKNNKFVNFNITNFKFVLPYLNMCVLHVIAGFFSSISKQFYFEILLYILKKNNKYISIIFL